MTFNIIEKKLHRVSDPDSIIYYLKLGAQLAREKDHLHNWVSYTLEFLSKDEKYRYDFNDDKLLRLWREPKDEDEASVSAQYYMFMGYYVAQDGKVQLATQYYSAALNVYDRHSVTSIHLFDEILKPLGNHYLRLGDFEHASEVGYRMRDWLHNTQDPDATAAWYNFNGLLHKLKGEWEEARHDFEQGLSVALADPAILGKLASNLGTLYAERGDDEGAGQYALLALRYLEQIEAPSREVNENLAQTLMIIAQTHLHAGDFSGAYDYINAALAYEKDTDTRTYAKMLVLQGLIFRTGGYPEHAIESFNAAMEQFISDFNPEIPFDNPVSVSLPAENTIFEALEGKADACRDLFHATDDIQYLNYGFACHKLALEAELLLRRQLSTEFSRNRVAADSRRRNGKALAILAELYKRDRKMDYAKEAFRTMEAAKANSVLESISLRLRDVESSTGADTSMRDLAERIRILEREFHKPTNEISGTTERTAVQRDLNLLKLEFAKKRAAALSQFAEYSQILGTQFNDDIFDVQLILRDTSQVLIEYFLDENFGYTIVRHSNGSISFGSLGDIREIIAATESLVRMLHSRTAMNEGISEFGVQAHLLYRRLITDVLGDIEGITSLIIIPDGVLNYLPFEVLIGAYDAKKSYAGMPYLMRDVTISYAHSSMVLSLQRRMVSGFSGGSAYAPFVDQRRGFSELEYSAEEIGATRGIRLRRFLGDEASFVHFLEHAPGSRIIHLATHAGIDSMGYGHIEFADSSMLLSDVYYLPMRCDLAVLSACESALGINLPAEGIQSFARAFAMAGTKSILASHWRLNDAAVAALIRSFYKNLDKGHTFSAALREAKLDYLGDVDVPDVRKSPHYWAAMVIVGGDGQLEAQSVWVWWVMGAGLVLILLFVGLRFGNCAH